MDLNDEIIVLNTTPLKDNSVVVHTLSREWGKRGFICPAKQKAFLQPLNVLEVDVAQNQKSNLWRISGLTSVYPLNGIRRSAGKNAISIFMAEVLFRSLQEGAREDGLYDWAISQIQLLDALQGDFANFHIHFLMDYAASMGFHPTWEDLLPFMDASGIASSGTSSASLSSNQSANLANLSRGLMQSSFADSMLIRMDGKTRSEICRRLLKYLEFHLETPLHIRSLDILSELF